MILGIGVAIAMINVKSVLDAWWKLASILSSGMLGLFLLGIISKNKNVVGAVIGVIIGISVIFTMTILNIVNTSGEGFSLHNYLAIVFGTTVIVFVGFLIGLARGKPSN